EFEQHVDDLGPSRRLELPLFQVTNFAPESPDSDRGGLGGSASLTGIPLEQPMPRAAPAVHRLRPRGRLLEDSGTDGRLLPGHRGERWTEAASAARRIPCRRVGLRGGWVDEGGAVPVQRLGVVYACAAWDVVV